MGEHDNKVAIVTGGAQGIGKGIVDILSSEGAKVCVADISEEYGQKAVEEIKISGGDALFIRANFEESTSPKIVVEKCLENYGRLDILVNNVGIQPPTSYRNVEKTPESVWDAIINVNLKSYFLMSKYSIPYIRKNGGGSIVNISSVQGLQSQKLVPPYAASKGGVLSLTRQMSLDYINENIRINAVCPGAFDTPMVRKSITGDINDSLKSLGQLIPIGRVGQIHEIGQVTSFLCSDKASYISGEYINVDGGIMAKGGWDADLQGQ
tara:strand:- start:104 stop:901 length:798 start_codon:yes stop_codon:yes gene_type:complete